MPDLRVHWRSCSTVIAAAAIACLAGCSTAPGDHGNLDGANILVFSETRAFRHRSIPAGVRAFEALGAEYGFSVQASEDSAIFNDRDLAAFDAIVFLSTTGDILNESEQEAMERYIQAGGGFVGVHAAADTEHQGDWYWYRNLVGAVFASHPAIQEARLTVIDDAHPSTSGLPETFLHTEEWYDFRDLYEYRTDVLTVDEQSYEGGRHGDYHPISWYHEYDGGRSFYTALGHTDAAFSEPLVRQHLVGGLAYAVGEGRPRDYTRARPEHDRFVRDRLVDELDEPVAFDLLPDGSALIVQRAGQVLHVAAEGGEQEIGRIDIYYDWDDEFGLIGVAADPDFDANRRVYLMYNRLRDSQLYQRISRFIYEDAGIDVDSEVLVLEFPVDQTCCHTGGNIEFDASGALFIATGDNTVPFQSRGYGPIDRREDRTHFDALRSSGNTNDLRGKILRIEPLPDGGYTVPPGNLFDDPAEGRPEIYAMGLRNPYTIAIDPETGHLFYGDIGPDAGESDELRGSRGYDEINRITGPGNFGWPLFIGDNGAYGDHDFASETTGELFDPGAPVNDSPRNSGAGILPPARPALIWYPYAPSERFPELGQGGRNALVAGVYRQPEGASQPFPAYFEGRLFIADFMRDWIKVVDFHAGGGVRQIAPFMPGESFSGILDLTFGDDGSLYILEYGRGWFAGNPEAGLSRLRYVGPGNRPPVPVIELSESQGTAPLEVTATAASSSDPDGDALTYEWQLGSDFAGYGETITLHIPDTGQHELVLVATDENGASARQGAPIVVGNAPPEMNIAIAGNRSFFWLEPRVLDYRVEVIDAEDGSLSDGTIDNERVDVTVDFSSTSLPHQTVASRGELLAQENGCMACHQVESSLVGPSYRDVAVRYLNSDDAVRYITEKTLEGGVGVWGEVPMAPHTHIAEKDARTIASFILSLAYRDEGLLVGDNLQLDAHLRTIEQHDYLGPIPRGTYVLRADYRDRGTDVAPPIAASAELRLIPARILLGDAWDGQEPPEPFTAWEVEGIRLLGTSGTVDETGTRPEPATLHIGRFDLTEIESVAVGHLTFGGESTWTIEIRRDSADGPLLGEASASFNEAARRQYLQQRIALTPNPGEADVFIAVRITAGAGGMSLIDIQFD